MKRSVFYTVIMMAVGLHWQFVPCTSLSADVNGQNDQDVMKTPQELIVAIQSEVAQNIETLSPDAIKISFKHLLCIIHPPKQTDGLSDVVFAFNSDDSNEFCIGVMLGWKHRILESETDLFQKLFWGDSGIMAKSSGRLLPAINPRLRQLFTISDPRHKDVYQKYPLSDSFISGVIFGKSFASRACWY